MGGRPEIDDSREQRKSSLLMSRGDTALHSKAPWSAEIVGGGGGRTGAYTHTHAQKYNAYVNDRGQEGKKGEAKALPSECKILRRE